MIDVETLDERRTEACDAFVLAQEARLFGLHAANMRAIEPLHRFKSKWAAQERIYTYLIQLNDPSVLTWSTSEIIEAYPDLYVVPFAALEETSSRSS